MNVQKLIEQLQKMPKEQSVLIVYDGAARMEADFVWVSRSGEVLLGGSGEPVYYDKDRPVDAPSEIAMERWITPE